MCQCTCQCYIASYIPLFKAVMFSIIAIIYTNSIYWPLATYLLHSSCSCRSHNSTKQCKLAHELVLYGWLVHQNAKLILQHQLAMYVLCQSRNSFMTTESAAIRSPRETWEFNHMVRGRSNEEKQLCDGGLLL